MSKAFARIFSLVILFLAISDRVVSEIYPQTQTIRGKVMDVDSRQPLVGANVFILESSPPKGSSTDMNGKFRIEHVPVGRIDLRVTYLGYEEKVIPNVLVNSGKEVILTIELQESVREMEEVVIRTGSHKWDNLNGMTSVSAKKFTVEETHRYAGSLNDPARMVSGYAGVTGDAMGNNDIIVRGNSSRGIQWRLDGVEIPNPNHFAGEGMTGGPINALNSKMLTTSEFYSGAFASEYGNAFSGIFDMNMRKGNEHQREYSFSVSSIGTDISLEGPFSQNYSGSYLVNYRYSSLDLLDRANLVDFEGVPKYQDASWKFHFPTINAGTFSLFGFGGLSNMHLEFEEKESGEVKGKGDMDSDVGFTGINHIYPINQNMYLKSTFSVAVTRSTTTLYEQNEDSKSWVTGTDNAFTYSTIKFSSELNKKFNARHKLQAGATYTLKEYDILSKIDYEGNGAITTRLDTKGNAGLLQGFANWKYRLKENLTLISGIHYMRFLLNDNSSLEPRAALEWNFKSSQQLSFGFGLHSSLEPISTYFTEIPMNENHAFHTPNKDLDLAKSVHYVLGYSNKLSDNMNLKAEIYYQDLYDIPVGSDPNDRYILYNKKEGFPTRDLVSKGFGENYGLELTIERYFADGYYFLITSSLYESKLAGINGVLKDSRFNGNYVSNVLLGKEFDLGGEEKARILSVNTKVTLIGGHMYSPVDLEASIQQGETVYEMGRQYALQGDDIFAIDLALAYRVNREKVTNKLKIDVKNLTNNQALVMEYYNRALKDIEKGYQLQLLPNVEYTLHF